MSTSNLLENIVASKKKSVEEMKERVPLKKIVAQCEKVDQSASLIKSIKMPKQVSIIAEMKKCSPSAGQIVHDYFPPKIARIYDDNGARAISVLTEENYFCGSAQHLVEVRKNTALPILRKDFIFDSYQIYESKVLGASAILLIVSILSKRSLSKLLSLTQEIGIEALVEVHSESELETALKEESKLIGINNRNLKNLSVNLENTFRLIEKIPRSVCIVAESGIKSPQTVQELKSVGVSAALIGESILKSDDMAKTLSAFVEAGK